MALPSLNVLSLCAGVGGLDLGLRLAVPDARTVCYVEWNHFAASVLTARAEDGGLDDAPVWDDVGSFDGGPWRGVVDCVVAGFPCQPVSLAGKRAGMADERFIWGDITRIVREVGPRYLFLENVPGILSADAGAFLGRVLGDVAELGFDAEWDVFSAAETGAPHRRERWFCLGVADAIGRIGRSSWPNEDQARATATPLCNGNPLADSERSGWRTAERDDDARQSNAVGRLTELADSESERRSINEKQRSSIRGHAPRCVIKALADTEGIREREPQHEGDPLTTRREAWRVSLGPSDQLDDTESAGLQEQWAVIGTTTKHAESQRSGGDVYPPARNDLRGWANLLKADPSVEPAVCRDADGLASGLDASLFTYRADRLRSVGNGVVPLTAALAWTVLAGRLGIDV